MPRRHSFRSARCVVTGASSGLGRALAVALARDGARLVITGRSTERLDQSARELVEAGASPDQVFPVVADLTHAEERDRVLAVAAERFGGALDLLVNAAGVGAYGRFESHDDSVLRALFEINLFALAAMTRGALPLLRRGDRPALVNLGSIVARRGLPGRSEYSASKHAVAGFTDAIRAEWRIDGIHVLLLNPGFTSTAFEDNVVIDTAVYKTAHKRSMTAEQVAQATLRALRRGANEVTLSGGGRLLTALNRLSPRFVDWGLGLWTRRLYADAAALEQVERRG